MFFNLVLTLNLLDGTAALLGNCELSPNKKEEKLKSAVHCRADPPSRSECGEYMLELNKGGGFEETQVDDSIKLLSAPSVTPTFFLSKFQKIIFTNKSLICI